MKAILMVDKPNCCEQCEFCKPEMSFWWELIGGKCSRTNKDVTEAIFEETIDKNCPLKPMPQRKKSLIVAEGDGARFEEPTEFEQGYNSCLDEILGGNE